MRLFHDDAHRLHDTQGEIKDGKLVPAYENPERMARILDAVADAGLTVQAPPETDPVAAIKAVHDPLYVDFLAQVHKDWIDAGRTGDVLPLVWPGPDFRTDLDPDRLGLDGRIGMRTFDTGTPICAGTWLALLAGSRSALATAEAVMHGAEIAVSLSRPPGHHAMYGQYGGYCFVNFAALAAQRMLEEGARRLAILDVDYHHGNGTQSLFYGRGDVLVVNVHSDTRHEYPYYLGHADERGVGEGENANLNLPLYKGADWAAYAEALSRGIEEIRAFKADALIVSFGGDTYIMDPLGRFRLTSQDYPPMGEAISRLNLPMAVILEGGYAVEALGQNLMGFLTGLNS